MFDAEWDRQHVARSSGQWPCEHLVRFMARHYRTGPPRQVLELGCGAGAQTAFLAGERHDIYAVDGSAAAIERAQELVEQRCGSASSNGERYVYGTPSIVYWQARDLAVLEFREAMFDVVIDVATLQHVRDDDALALVERARRWLKPEGRFFSLHAGAGGDRRIVSKDRTVEVRQAGRAEIMGLFHGYDLDLGHEDIDRPDGGRIANWIVEAQVPG